MKISELTRNDLDGAMALYRERVLAGTWSSDVARIVLRLQDDPKLLMTEMVKASKEPDISAALEKRK